MGIAERGLRVGEEAGGAVRTTRRRGSPTGMIRERMEFGFARKSHVDEGVKIDDE